MSELEDDLDLLSAELVARQDELVALYALTEATRNELSIAPVVASVIQQVQKLFGVTHVFAVMDGAQLSAIYGPNAGLEYQQSDAAPLAEAELAAWFTRAKEAGDTVLDNQATETVANLLVTPVNCDSGLVAALGVADRRDGDFMYPDKQMLRTISTWLGAHIDSVLLHTNLLAQTRIQSEMELARRVQGNLQPKTIPHVQGLHIAGLSDAAFEVGGDFFDFLPQKHGLLLAVADVSGKGMSAAMLMGMVRTTMRNAAQFMDSTDPAALMAATNAALYDDFTDVGMLATAFIARYEPNSTTLAFANAGHSPVVYCPLDGPATLLEADGTALGILDFCFCETQSVRLAKGDVLLAGSDGLVEARNADGELYGYERLNKLVKETAHESAENMAQLILDAVNEFAGDTPQDDDQTVVILKGTSDDV